MLDPHTWPTMGTSYADRWLVRLVTLATIAFAARSYAATDSSDCSVFLLRDAAGKLLTERSVIPGSPTTVRTYHANSDTRLIDVVFPVGPGGSGSLVRLADNRTLTVTCDNGTLTVDDRLPDGKGYTRPGRTQADLARYDVRLSVTAGDGRRACFAIMENGSVAPETVGPVLDMFGGRIPAKSNEFILFTDTYLHDLPDHVSGIIPLEIDRWPITTAHLPNGTKGDFIVDLGAGTTVVSRSFLPESAGITKSSMVQHSAAGRHLLKYAPGGATGAVQNVMGSTIVPELAIGTLQANDVRVDVLTSMPDLFDRPIAGIIGLDLLRRADVLTLRLGKERGHQGELVLGESTTAPALGGIEVPFTIANSHVMVTGKMKHHAVHFILDTGAPESVLDLQAARRIGIETHRNDRKTARGLDGGHIELHDASKLPVTLADQLLPGTAFRVSALPIFASLRVHDQNVGLLGNTFFRSVDAVQLDFDHRVIRLVPR